MTAKERHMARMTWAEVDEYLTAHSGEATVFIPIGPVEEHGRTHMVLEADIVQARGIVERVAERHHGLIFPAIPLMACGISKPVTGTIAVDADTTLYTMTRDMVTEFATKGFKNILWFTGHGGYSMVAMRRAIIDVQKRLEPQGITFWSNVFNFEGSSRVQAQIITDTPEKPDMHAAGREISRMLALDPNGLREPYPPADYHKKTEKGMVLSDTGITGDPSKATPQFGYAIVEDTVQYLMDQLNTAKYCVATLEELKAADVS